MTTVDRVKQLCKERKLAVSKLEKDLGFGNGYLSQLKKGTLLSDRLMKIAEYLDVSSAWLSGVVAEDPKVKFFDPDAGGAIPYTNDDAEEDEFIRAAASNPYSRVLFYTLEGATPEEYLQAIEAAAKIRRSNK